MEKIISIDGRDIKLKSTGAYLLRYKSQFKRDAIRDLMELEKSFNTKTGKIEDTSGIDFEVFFNMVWTLAKTADASIPPPIEWLDTFSTFPLDEILPDAMELIVSSIQSSTKTKKK